MQNVMPSLSAGTRKLILTRSSAISQSPPSGPSGGKSLSLLTAMGWSGQTSDARMYVFMASFGSSVCARVQRALASATFSHASS